MPINKLNTLLKQDRKIFHIEDLRILWQIDNANTLRKSISRFLKNDFLFTIKRGLYSVIPPVKLDPIVLGAALVHGYTYLSCETVLAQEGIINQSIYSYSFISDFSKRIAVDNRSYLIRKLQDKFLHNTTGIIDRGDGILVASVNRAIADMLYFSPRYYFDADSIINWDEVRIIQKEVGYI